jgi:hypothetical protein
VLTDVSVTDNTASSSSSGLAQGGGIYNAGTLTLNNVTVSGNTASSSDGNAQGGGIYNSGTLTVSASVISGNTATNTSGGEAAGGGICNTSGATFFSLTDSTVSGNTASNSASNGEALGGGIFCSNRTFQSILTFQATNDTVWNNNVTESGGRGTAEGGGIYTTLTTTTTLINLTVGDNTATASGGTAEGGGIFLQGSQTTNLVNTIVSDPNGPSSSPDVSGTVTNAQNNDFASTAGLTITNNLGGNLLNIAPLLGSLTFNGGPTPTVAELSGSPTIDAGTSSSRLGTIPTTDQRGAPRPDVAGTNPDIGAFEFQAPPTPTPTPPPTPITVPSPLNTAVTLANTLTNRQIGFALAAQPLLSNPLDLQLAFLSFTAVNQALAAQPLNNALLFEEAVLAQALAAFINNPGGYAANSTATNQLAQLIVLDSLDLSSNPLFQTLAGLEEGALAKTLDLFLLTSSGSQTTAAEQALQGVAPLL